MAWAQVPAPPEQETGRQPIRTFWAGPGLPEPGRAGRLSHLSAGSCFPSLGTGQGSFSPLKYKPDTFSFYPRSMPMSPLNFKRCHGQPSSCEREWRLYTHMCTHAHTSHTCTHAHTSHTHMHTHLTYTHAHTHTSHMHAHAHTHTHPSRLSLESPEVTLVPRSDDPPKTPQL